MEYVEFWEDSIKSDVISEKNTLFNSLVYLDEKFRIYFKVYKIIGFFFEML